jgi:SAM-dependent methyltransferase
MRGGAGDGDWVAAGVWAGKGRYPGRAYPENFYQMAFHAIFQIVSHAPIHKFFTERSCVPFDCRFRIEVGIRMKRPEPTFFDSAQEYWDSVAGSYDENFTRTLIGLTRRLAVWRELDRVFQPGQRVLELNCGTGVDAVHLANRGIEVLACDISPRMVEIARDFAATAKAEGTDFRVLPTENIDALSNEGPFDGAFSNFAGLNCVENLPAAVRNLAGLLKPGAPVLVSMMGRFVPWEIVWYLAHGEAKKAVRRLIGGDGLSRGALKIRQLSVREITRIFAQGFRRRRWRGIGIGVGPTYMESWARRFPTVTKELARADNWVGGFTPFRNMADCVLLEFERTAASRDRECI